MAVWDLCRDADVNQAAALLAAVRAPGRGLAGTLPKTLAPALSLPEAAVALALEAAANCSSATRQTPMHAAALAGSWDHVVVERTKRCIRVRRMSGATLGL